MFCIIDLSTQFPLPTGHGKESGMHVNRLPKNINRQKTRVKAMRALHVFVIHETWNNRRYCQRMDNLQRAEENPQHNTPSQTACAGLVVRRHTSSHREEYATFSPAGWKLWRATRGTSRKASFMDAKNTHVS